MIKVLDMRFIRYVNLFNKITRIRTKHCFEYNNIIIFVIPRRFVINALGQNNINITKLSQLIGKKVRIIGGPNGKEDLRSFVSSIIRPVKFKSIEIKDEEVIINAGTPSKASLIGKDKLRLFEMENILEQYFGTKKLRIK
jgi:transcription antitermination factor NusA-like protein